MHSDISRFPPIVYGVMIAQFRHKNRLLCARLKLEINRLATYMYLHISNKRAQYNVIDINKMSFLEHMIKAMQNWLFVVTVPTIDYSGQPVPVKDMSSDVLLGGGSCVVSNLYTWYWEADGCFFYVSPPHHNPCHSLKSSLSLRVIYDIGKNKRRSL